VGKGGAGTPTRGWLKEPAEIIESDYHFATPAEPADAAGR